jgi:molecular chaperone GrpE
VDGINLIYQKLLKIIEGEGVEIIPVDGEFDPSIHEAISQIENAEIESGKIVDVMRKGYKIKDRVIRPALVIVSR